MPKLNQTILAEAIAPQAAEDQTEDNWVCLIQFVSTTFYNGQTRIAGTTIGNVPHQTARKLEQLCVVKIIGSPHRIERQERDLSAIENQTPGNLDPNIWHPANPVVGQRSSVFINIKELEALQNR
jgi:hypothetical protein